jgi:hypothetical protein
MKILLLGKLKVIQAVIILSLLVGMTYGYFGLVQPVIAAPIDQRFNPSEPDNILAVSVSPSTVKEGNDFATSVLSDPWDMNEFSDISRYLNESSVVQHLTNISVQNSIFSAQSVSTDAQFFTLFPGYQSSIDSLNIPIRSGSLFPINAAKYHCLYTRMKIETSSSDTMRIFWFGDKYLGNGQFGVTKSITIPTTGWQLYSIDLNLNFDAANSNTSWNNAQYWRGLRFDPTTRSGINFAVDWVRLTDCASDNTTLTWTASSGTKEIWAGIGAKNQDFRVGSVDGNLGSYTLDVQGWEAGQYYIGIKDAAGTISWSSQPLTIDAAPRITIQRPTYNSGASLTWSMNDASDLVTNPADGTRCVNYYFQDGSVYLDTPPPSQLASDCLTQIITGAYASDPQLVLTMPSYQIDTSIYRYLTIRTHMDGMIQDINNGWAMRWLWKTYDNNDPSRWCINVSNDIVFDPGWQTIVVDLLDGTSGTTEDWVGNGNCHSRQWADNPAVWLRIDPNENTTDYPMAQIIDSISLSQLDSVSRGQLFPVQVESNEPAAGLRMSLYYTTDQQNANQNPATVLDSPALPQAQYRAYLPLTFRKAGSTGSSNPNLKTIYWDTTNVAPGVYYICVEVSDGLNKITGCSSAPLAVR